VATDNDRPRVQNSLDQAPDPRRDDRLEALRGILFDGYRERVDDLETTLDDIEHQIKDEEALIATVTPVVGDAIRRRIRDAREEMIEALYPIIGQLVVRAVSEAIRDLARTIDAQVRTSFTPQVLWWRLRARIGGASPGEMALRQALPFQVAQVFLIHRRTGLLLQHVSIESETATDSDLIGSMLTAIRDFAEDAFGRGQEADLDVVDYGERRILIEAGEHAYLAVVVDGVEPPGFRSTMRDVIIDICNTHARVLRDYDGDPTPLSSAQEALRSLMVPASPPGLSTMQKRLLAGAFGVLFVCVIMGCAAGRWAWQAWLGTPTPTAVPVIAEATASATPTPLPTLTHTPTPRPTHTATSTPRPTPAPPPGVMTGHVWMRGQPTETAPLLGIIVERGEAVTVLAVYGEWCKIEWAPEGESQVVGWVPLRWVGTMKPIPNWIVTPMPEG
jgi:hypothetical protein